MASEQQAESGTERGRDRSVSGRVTRWIENLPSQRLGRTSALAATLGIAGAAWLLRIALDDALPPGFPYLTFFPAVVLTAFMFGARLGSLSALLCGLVAWYFFIHPTQSFNLAGKEVALGLYVFVVATDLALIHGMQIANRQLRKERELSRDLADAKEQVVRELQQQVTKRKLAVDALRESDVKTHLATRTAGIGLWQWNTGTDEVRWDDTMFELYGMPPTADGSVNYSDYLARVHPEDAPEQDRILRETVRNCSESTRDFRIRRGDDGSVRHLRAVEIARAGLDGKTEWLVGTNLDITDQKNRESHVQMLLGEINHRAKNLLAVVLSVAKRTHGTNHAEFMANFAARIQSLAAGQDLLVEKEWRGVNIHELIRAQLSHYKDLIGRRILLSGEDLALSSSAVQAIGMTIHELVTNAAKYGALSNDCGRITLNWHLEGAASDRFVMTWVETDGPPVTAPTRTGFGSTVTGDMVRAGLDAEVKSDFAPSGFSWKLTCAINEVIEQAGS